MRWFGISGSWRETNAAVEQDVQEAVATIMKSGNGIVTGGAIGVDHFAIREALVHDPAGTRIKVCIPGTLERYETHFRARAGEGLITREVSDQNFKLLRALQRAHPASLIENPKDTIINRDAYFRRNSRVAALADELYAFWVNQSPGTADTIKKTEEAGKPVTIWEYTLSTKREKRSFI